MQKNIKLAIPEPCHEKWNDFTKTKQGGFCGSCQKEVIDFTGWSEEQLKTYFRKPSLNTCGRFRQEQLKVYTFSEPSSSKRNWLSFALVSMLLLFSSRHTSANTVNKIRQHLEQLLPGVTMGEPVAIQSDSSIVVKGKVMYAGDSSTLPGVNVTCKRTNVKTVTDADGNFELTLKNFSVQEILVFDFIGMTTIEYSVNTNSLNEIKISMTDDTMMLGGTVGTIVVGGVRSNPWYSPRRWWWGVTTCIRK